MDRETRKANLRKLQLPGTSTGKTQRKTRQGAKTSVTSSISNYFPTPEKLSKQPPDKEEEKPLPNDKPPENDQEEPTTKPPKTSRAKRTKLDEFVFRQPEAIPADLKTDRAKPVHDDDFDVPEKKAKKAPPRSSKTEATKTKTAKTTRKKKQTTIKSAFMRNEQLFAEIAAQHCAADNFDGDDVQLAIAISQSEAESRGIVAINADREEAAADLKEGGEQNAELIRQKLEKYGFRTAEKEDYNAFTTAFMTKSNGRAKKRSKWANKFTALTLRDEQTQNKKLQQKIDYLLNQQFRMKPLKAEENLPPRFQLQSRLLKRCQKEISKKVLQLPDNLEIPHEEYFVKELFEISNLTPGHLLKNWGAIQGRETPKKRRGPYSEGMSIKLHKIYADLEKHFENIKNSNIAQASSSKVAVEINKEPNANIEHPTDKPIVNDYFNTLRGQESGETIMDSGSSVTSSIYKHIKSVLPPTKSLDLMHVSYSTIKSDMASINSSQSAESNDSQKTDTSTALQEEALNIKAFPIENHNNESPIIDLGEDVVMVSSGSSTTNSIDKITPKNTTTINSLDLMHASSTSSYRADDTTINSLHRVECNTLKNLITPERSLANTQCHNNVSVKVQAAKPFSCTPARAEASINSSQKTRSNSPDLFADSDVEMEEEDENANNERGADDVNNVNLNKGSTSKDDIGITTYEIYSSDEVKNTLSSEPTDPRTSLKEKLSSSLKCQEQENVVDLTQDDGGDDLWQTAPLNQSKPLVEVDLFADSPINEEEFEFTPDINSNSQTSKYLQQHKSEDTFNLSLSLKTANASDNQTKDDTFKFTLSLEMTAMEKERENEVIFRDFQEQQRKSSLTNLQEGIKVKNLEPNQAQHSPETFYISEESKSQHESENDDNAVFKGVPIQHNETSTSSLEKAPECAKELEISFLSSSLEKNKGISLNSPLDVEIVREHNFQLEDDDDVILHEIEINQTNTSFLNFQGDKQLQTCFHRETATEPDVKRKRSVAGNDTIFKELYNKYLGCGAGAATQQQKTSKCNESILRKSFSQIVPKVVTPTAANTYNDTNFNMDLEITMENFRANRKSLSFNSTSPVKDTIPTNIGLSKSQSFTMHNVSIDLTQIEDDAYAGVAAAAITEEDHDEDDDCLVLSDDEINYSIWKSNKTGKFKESDINSDSEEDDIKRNSPIPKAKINQKYVTPANIKVSSQQSYSDFELKSPKNTPGLEDKLDRSKFGILEEFSEPIDFTPNLSTPTKILQEASFLQSPAEESSQVKRYSIAGSRSAQKFQDLLNGIDNEDVRYNNCDDYDEFDLMIYQNQMTNNTSATTSLPQGFDQLMTAEISFKESQKSLSSSQSSSVEIVEEQQSSTVTKSINSKAITKTKSLNDIKTTTKFPNFHSSASIITKSTSTTTSAAIKTITDSDHQQVLTVNNKTYKVRSINTPKPIYSLYTEAELLKELYNYGIKPLKRKQAVKMLEYIYLQTHPIIVDDPEEIIKVPEDFAVPSTSKCSVKNKVIVPTNSILVDGTATSDDVAAAGVGNKLNLQDGCGADMLRYSCDLKAELIDEHYILQTNVTKKTQQPLMPFHIAWYNLVCANRKLHESILMYEPIDLQEIYLFLKGLGYRYDPKDLKQFFDRRCIIFRYDLATAGSSNNGNKVKDTNRHVRKKKKLSNKQLTNFVNIS